MASATTSSGVPTEPTLTPLLDTDIGDDPYDEVEVGSIVLMIAPPTSSGGSDLTGYQLQRYENGQWNTITAPATDATTYTDSGLTPGVKYYYALRASNSAGAGPWSDVKSALAKFANPDKITTLTATATGETTIRLTWTVPARQRHHNRTGYELSRDGTSAMT